MSMLLHISAVIPAFNREKTIGRAIESVLAQDLAPAELLVVDDGSQDGTAQVVAGYGQRVRLLKQAHAGVSAARNHGVREAKHEWIAFLDSDDYWLPGHLTRMAEAIEATKGEAAIYFADMKLSQEDGSGTHWERCGFSSSPPFEVRKNASDWTFMPVQPMILPASVIRRNCYWECGGLPEYMNTREDTLLFYKLGLLYPACAVSGTGAVIMTDGGGRLTESLGSLTIAYWLTSISMYKELLAIVDQHQPQWRRAVLRNLSNAYHGGARAFSREGFYIRSVRNLVASAVTSRDVFVDCTLQSTRRFLTRVLRRAGHRTQAQVSNARRGCGTRD